MNKKQRSEACGYLLSARGWASCYFPIVGELNENETIVVRAGNLQGITEKIDKVLALLGHTGGGSVN